jgi:hypothetical protein
VDAQAMSGVADGARLDGARVKLLALLVTFPPSGGGFASNGNGNIHMSPSSDRARWEREKALSSASNKQSPAREVGMVPTGAKRKAVGILPQLDNDKIQEMEEDNEGGDRAGGEGPDKQAKSSASSAPSLSPKPLLSRKIIATFKNPESA